MRARAARIRSASARLVVLGCSFLPIHAAQGNAQDADWPQWRGLHHDGLSSGVGWSPQGKAVWSKDVGLGYSSPSISRARLYIHGFDVERNVDVLRCLQTQNGLELWRREMPARRFDQDHEGGTLTTPTVDGELLFVGEREGTLSCYQAATGRLVWHKDLSFLFDVSPGMYGFSGSPLVAGEFVVVNADKVFAFRKQTGDFVWSTGSLQAVYSTPLPFTLAERSCVAIFGQKALDLLDLGTGETLRTFPWQKDPRVVCSASPVAVGERLFLSSAYEHGCALLDFTDGGARALWANLNMRSKMAGCVLVDGFLYGFDESLLKCLDLEGNERWRVRGLGNGALSGGDGKLALLDSRGELIVAQATPEAFHELAREKLFDAGVCWTPPVIAGGFLYCRNNQGQLVCRDHRAGAAPEPSSLSGSSASSPSPAGAGPLPAAEELFARHLERIGGVEALQRHGSLRISGTYEMRSQGFVPVPFTIDWLAPDKRRVSIQDVPPRRFVHVRVFDGELAYELGPLGAKLVAPERQEELRAASELRAAADYRVLYPTMNTAAVVTFADRSCYRVDALTKGGARRSLYFDVATGFLTGRASDAESTVVFDDYREFDGLRLAAFEEHTAPDTGIEETFRIERVDFDGVDAALFERPDSVKRLLTESRGKTKSGN